MPSKHQTAYERHAPDERIIDRAVAGTQSAVFWFDEAGRAADYPKLTTSARFNLTIVGGGYLGLWTAVLAKRRNPGLRVAVLEAQTIGWAASGRNGGFCEASITHGAENGRTRWPDEYDQLERLGTENLDAFANDVKALQLDCHWERNGAFSVAVEPHQVAWLGDGPDVLDADQMAEQINSPLFLGGAFAEDCALVQPARLARELARAASDLGVEIFEHTKVDHVQSPRAGGVLVHTKHGVVITDRVVLATNVFRSLLRRARPMTVPVYDYVLVTEPLRPEQMASIGWEGRQGLADLANQFHYIRLTQDNRILFGGYDAIYHAGRQVKEKYEQRPSSYRTLASHFLAMFPQLADVTFSHKWAGAIDASTQFTAFYGLARQGRVAYSAGFTGLGVGATRFAGEVLLDLLECETTERTNLEMVRKRPLPFPPEPALGIGINLTRWSLNRADHREGHRNAFLRTLDAAGLGFDS